MMKTVDDILKALQRTLRLCKDLVPQVSSFFTLLISADRLQLIIDLSGIAANRIRTVIKGYHHKTSLKACDYYLTCLRPA